MSQEITHLSNPGLDKDPPYMQSLTLRNGPSAVLWDHDCTLLNRGDVVTVLGLTEEGDPVEGAFNGYELEFEGASYVVLNIDVQERDNQNIQYAIKSNLDTVRITPGADMWVIGEFLEANAIAN